MLENLIEQCRRAMKNKNQHALDKGVKKLRNLGKLDIIIKEKATLLTYYTMSNQLKKVTELLTGNNPASVTTVNKDGYTSLYYAITYICTDETCEIDGSMIDELLKYSPEKQLLQPNNEGDIPLHVALRNGNLEITKKLLQVIPQEQLMYRNANDQMISAFDIAYESKNKILILWLFETYPEIRKMKSIDDFTPLHRACDKGDPWFTILLLTKDPREQVTAKDNIGAMPIDLACKYNHTKIVKALLGYEPEAQILHEHQMGNIIFTLCANGSYEAFEVIILFAKQNQININKLLLTQQNIYISPGTGIDKKILRSILKKQPALNIEEDEILKQMETILQSGEVLPDCFPLEIIIISPITDQDKKLKMIGMILELVPDEQLEIQKKEEKTCALHIAIKHKNIEIVRVLTSYPNQKQYLLENKDGKIPLHCALEIFEKNHENQLENEIVTLLLECEPAEQFSLLEKHMKEEAHPLMLGIFANHVKFIEQFIQNKTSEELLAINEVSYPLLAMATIYPPVLKVLLKADTKRLLINSRDKTYQETVLHTASSQGLTEVCAILIEHGADVEAQNHHGWTPLHAICGNGYLSCFNLLMTHAKNLDITTHELLTPLHIACGNGNLTIVRILIQKGVFIDYANKKGKTPLFTAVFLGHHEVVEFLLANGANPNIGISTNGQNISPLLIAIQKWDKKSIRQLLKAGANIHQVFLEEKNITLLDIIRHLSHEKRGIYHITLQIIKELKLLPEEKNVTENNVDLSSIPKELFLTPRQFFLEMGYSQEDITSFEEEREKNELLLRTNTNQFEYNKSSAQTISYWDGNSFSSQDNFVLPAVAAGGQAFCYLDENNLETQGCDISKLNIIRRLKFDGRHIKKLDATKGIYQEWVKLPNQPEPQQITYTHELKINQVDRVLLFPIKADNGNASLYCGTKYISGGLHSSGKISSLTTSTKSTSREHFLEIQSPNVCHQKNTACTT